MSSQPANDQSKVYLGLSQTALKHHSDKLWLAFSCSCCCWSYSLGLLLVTFSWCNFNPHLPTVVASCCFNLKSKSNVPSKSINNFSHFHQNPSKFHQQIPIFPSFFGPGDPPDPEPPIGRRSSTVLTPPGGGGALRVAGTGGEGTAADGRGD